MSQMRQILAHPTRLKLLAQDMISHYDALCAENPSIVKKAMIVCADRKLPLHCSMKLWQFALIGAWQKKRKMRLHFLQKN